jgi:hypothetical protein
MANEPVQQQAESILDHLLLGVPDLDTGIDWVQEKTHVRAIEGGSHPGAGTRNALLSMGNRQYIEIISIDTKQTSTSQTAELIRGLRAPQLITWAAATTNIVSLRHLAIEADFAFEGPINGSRVKPDGGILRWKTVKILTDCGDAIPFFIEWDAGTEHPSADSPSGCRLVAFEIRHPEAVRVRETLRMLGITATVRPGEKLQFEAVVDTPAGRIRFS